MFWLGCLFSIMGLVAFLYQKLLIKKLPTSYDWPSTDGEIVKSQVDCQNGGHGLTVFKADVEYNYKVEARLYKGEKVCLGDDKVFLERCHVESRCAEYPYGSIVQVFYNPLNPADACLERWVDTPYKYTIVATVFLFSGGGMMLGSLY